MTNRKLRAFSLFEMSIAILVIGIIMGGVLGGKKLISLSNIAKARALTNSSPVSAIPGLTLWLETTSTKSFTLSTPPNGTLIDTWKDINPQATIKKDVTDQTSGTSTDRPIYLANGINGLPVLSFDGVDDSLARANTLYSEIGKTDEITIFAVLKTIGPAKDSALVQWDNASTRINIHAPWSNSNIYWDFGLCCTANGRINTTMPAGFLDSNNIISAIRRADNTADFLINNTSLMSSTTMSNTIDTTLSAVLYVMSSAAAGTNHRGYIGELIIFEEALTEAQRLEVTQYLSKKWGIKLT